jgi:hypothetical protein
VEVTVGPHKVTVVSDATVTLALAKEGKQADSDAETLTIRIRHDLHPSVWREVLCHETLHVIIAQTHLAARWDDDTEEEVVRALSPYLSQAGWFRTVKVP